MALKILFIMDPREKILPHMDTSLRIIESFLEHQHEIYYWDVLSFQKFPINELPIERVTSCDHRESNFLKSESPKEMNCEDFDIIFHRLDPPVDDFYKKYCQAFEALKKPLQINDPWEISNTYEHVLPTEYPQYSIPTKICKTYTDFENEILSQDKESVAKPINECSGIGIEFFNSQTEKHVLKKYWDKYSPDVIVQPYRDIITESGDLRVLVFNEVILGGVLRKAAQGSRLSNIHAGGSAHPFELTPEQIAISQEVCRELKKRKLYFIGLDFIGNELSEINITSPTTLTYINDFYKVKAEETIVQESIKLWEQHKK